MSQLYASGGQSIGVSAREGTNQYSIGTSAQCLRDDLEEWDGRVWEGNARGKDYMYTYS